jgi:hypothetical protein
MDGPRRILMRRGTCLFNDSTKIEFCKAQSAAASEAAVPLHAAPTFLTAAQNSNKKE